MSLIERLYTSSWLVVLIFILFMQSCGHKRCKYLSNNLERGGGDKGELIRKRLFLAMEVCDLNDINLCYDGHGQFYRVIYPFFIDPNFCDITESYKSVFYSIDIASVVNVVNRLDVAVQSRDTIMNKIIPKVNNVDSLISISSLSNLRYYSKEDKKLGIDRDFDGNYYYLVISADVDLLCGGKRNLVIPNWNKTRADSAPVTIVKSTVYYIVNIENVKYISPSSMNLRKRKSGTTPQE